MFFFTFLLVAAKCKAVNPLGVVLSTFGFLSKICSSNLVLASVRVFLNTMCFSTHARLRRKLDWRIMAQVSGRVLDPRGDRAYR